MQNVITLTILTILFVIAFSLNRAFKEIDNKISSELNQYL